MNQIAVGNLIIHSPFCGPSRGTVRAASVHLFPERDCHEKETCHLNRKVESSFSSPGGFVGLGTMSNGSFPWLISPARWTDGPNPRDYWCRTKRRKEESFGVEMSTDCRHLKLISADGKIYQTEVVNAEATFDLIQSTPSRKAEPFNRWLAPAGIGWKESLGRPGNAPPASCQRGEDTIDVAAVNASGVNTSTEADHVQPRPPVKARSSETS